MELDTSTTLVCVKSAATTATCVLLHHTVVSAQVLMYSTTGLVKTTANQAISTTQESVNSAALLATLVKTQQAAHLAITRMC